MQRGVEAGRGKAAKRTTSGPVVVSAPASTRTTSDDELFSLGGVRRRQRDEDLLADLKAFAEAVPPHQRTMERYRRWPRRKFHDHTIVGQLGGWLAALERAGVDYGAAAARGSSRETVEADIRAFARVTPLPGRTLANFKDWPGRKVSVWSVAKHFGNWHDAFVQLRLPVPGRTRSEKHSDEELLLAVERIWRWCGRAPSAGDFKKYALKHNDGVSHATIYYRFGPLRPFLAAFAAWKRGKMSGAQLLLRAQLRRQREPIPNGLRYRLLRERAATCARCGQSPNSHPGTVVEIDHVLPVSRGGTNAEDNLQILCQRCNAGKGNRFHD